MTEVCVCSGCGRTINKDYIYCPWCGLCRLDADDSVSMDAIFEQLERKQSAQRQERVSRLKEQLDALDRELAVLEVTGDAQ